MLSVPCTEVKWNHLEGHTEITHLKLWRTQIWHNTAVFPFSSSLNLCLSFFSFFLKQVSDSVCRLNCPVIHRHIYPFTSECSFPKWRSRWEYHYLIAKKKKKKEDWSMFLKHLTLNINKDLNLSAGSFTLLLCCFFFPWYPFSKVPSICMENIILYIINFY